MTPNLHVGDIGTIVEYTVTDGVNPINISDADTLTITFQKPDGRKISKDAALTGDGADGKMHYTIEDGDLSVAGDWKIQAFVVLSGGEWHSSVEILRIMRNI